LKYIYKDDAGEAYLRIEAELYKYLFKVRRQDRDEDIYFRNLKDDFIYLYKVKELSKKYAILRLVAKEKSIVASKKYLHIGWCVIDTKSIEKSLPTLNEIGVSKISFVYCKRSQKNFKIDLERFNRIVINSSQQCGRSRLMEFEVLDGIKEYFKKYPNSAVLDFGGEKLSCAKENLSILIGCEGGFDEEERNLFVDKRIYGFDTPMILKSESAVVAVGAIYLLQ